MTGMPHTLAGLDLSTIRSPSWRRWTLMCAAGETIGMVAAAAAAWLSLVVVGEPHDLRSAAVAVALPVAGGVIEGYAVGSLQFRVLGEWLTGLSRRAWIGATVAVATVFWLLGMLPSTLDAWLRDSSSTPGGPPAPGGPSGWVMSVGGLLAGLVAGAVFGAVQSRVLVGHVQKPHRWVLANALGWGVAMAVIFTGASVPQGQWSGGWLLLLGGITGVLAGLAIGAITGLFLPAIDESAPCQGPLVNRWVLWLLRSPAHRLLSGSLLDLRYTGTSSGRSYALPVQYAPSDDGFVVLPGHPERKTWWRNFVLPEPVIVLHAGVCRLATASVVEPDDPQWAGVVAAYVRRFPRSQVPAGAPLVRLTVASAVVDHPHQAEVRSEVDAFDRSGVGRDREGH